MKTILKSYPAYDVVSKEINGVTKINAGDLIMSNNHKFMAGSVASYAIKYNKCPIKSYSDAIERGHEAYFLVPLGSCISRMKQERKEYIALSVGDRVHFQGYDFEVTRQNNDNRGLKLIK